MWTCPKCATKVDPSMEVCWNCGTSVDGVEDPTFATADADPVDDSPLDQEQPVGDAPIPQPADEAEGELVECYWALDLMQARFLADKLTEDGIYAVSDTHDLHEALASMSSGPRVWVRVADLPRAKAWLEDYESRTAAER